MKRNAVLAGIVFAVGTIPALMLLASHIALSFFSEPNIATTTTSIPLHHMQRLVLAPAYLAVFTYFVGGTLGLVDMTCGASRETRRMVNAASIAFSVMFLLSSGAAVLTNILTLPTIVAPVTEAIESTYVVDFVGIVVMSACYIAFFCFWFTTLKDDQRDYKPKDERVIKE